MSNPVRPSSALRPLGWLVSRLRWPWDWWRTIDRDDQDDKRHQEPSDLAAETARAQGRVIRRAFGDGVAAAARDGGGRTDDDAEAAYFFRPGHALVRESRLEEVLTFFRDNERDFVGPAERSDEQPSIPGLVTIRLPSRRDGEDDVLRTLDELDGSILPDDEGRRAVSPDHVLYVTNVAPHFCPATEPEYPSTDEPVPHFGADPSWGHGVRVSVVDTGWWAPAPKHASWLASGVYADPLDVEDINPKAIHEYGGHGTFVAGVIKRAAPDAHIQVQGALTHGGAIYESAIVAQLHQAYTERDHPQLISMSAGTHSRKDFPLIAFDALMAALHERDIDPLLVAAAGNDYGEQPFWPAAFPWAIGVGSVDANKDCSDYSNIGPWVKVYARGRDHINAFPVGIYPCYEPANAGQVRQFDGLAQWSGTSFSTPVVTGLIAAEMSRTGKDPRAAYAAVLKAGVPGTDRANRAITIVGPLT
ncbi:S8/S53 family peptidase [Nocardioides maradonensis]